MKEPVKGAESSLGGSTLGICLADLYGTLALLPFSTFRIGEIFLALVANVRALLLQVKWIGSVFFFHQYFMRRLSSPSLPSE